MKVYVAFIVAILVLSVGCLEKETEEKNKNPDAKIYVAQSTFNLDDTVSIEGIESNDPDGKIVQYMFWYGDGANSGMLDTGYDTHVYTEPGEITITLVVWDDDGAVGTATTGIIKINDPPVADQSITDDLGLETNDAWVKEMVYFNANASYDNDGFILWASTFWEFGDGGTATGRDATHRYLSNGTYMVNLTIEDNDEAEVTISENITVTMQRFKATWDQNTTEQIEYRTTPETYMFNDTIQNFVVDFDRINITKIWINFTWQDNEIGSEPDEFTFRINTSFGEFKQETTLSGEVSFTWTRQYKSRLFYAINTAEAEIFANGLNMTDIRWSGTYDVYAYLQTGHWILPFFEDSGEDYILEIDIEYYEGPPTIEEID